MLPLRAAVLATLLAQIVAVTTAATPSGPSLRNGFDFGYHDFEFWHWDRNILDERKNCKNFSSEVQTRITGGNIAERNMFPYQAAILMLQTPKVIQCGGALISEHFVLTAAHCLFRSSIGKIFLGTNVYADNSSAAAIYNVSQRHFYIYENYIPYGILDDIGLIHLEKPAPLSDSVQTIPLALSYMTQLFLDEQMVTTSGWGRTSDNQQVSDYLLYYTDALVLNQQQCACFFLSGLVRSRNHLCTDGTGGKGSCEGDSGGPLTYFHRGVNYLVGITAFGSAGGCEIGFPSVYTRITTYLGWIAGKTNITVN